MSTSLIKFLTAARQLSEWQHEFFGCLKDDPDCIAMAEKGLARDGGLSLQHAGRRWAKAVAGAFSASYRYLPRKVVPET